MKNLFLIALMMGSAFSQAVTSKVAVGESVHASTDRTLTAEESLKLQLTQARIQHLQDKYKIAEYQAEVQAVIAEQQSVFAAACKSVGIPEDKVATECRLNTGVDADGKPIAGPDGKPVASRVWREVAKEAK